MDDDLPTEFDLVVVGTGFVESIVASAASRVGKSVLHVDPNDFYGGTWASFNLDALQTFISSIGDSEDKTFNSIKNASQNWSCSAPETAAEEQLDNTAWTKEKVLKEFRRFNIDLTPKLLFSCGKLVKLLISSNICRYAEFRAVDHVCTIVNGQTRSVPCSRTDVFNTKDLNIVEKRLLMKLLTSCMGYDENPGEFKDYEGKTFLEYLKSVKLTENIIHCVLYSISMSNEHTPLKEGIENAKKFLNSLGRYGNTPFLFPMYGCGEIPQCFCRLCAVFGGIYCLKRSVESAAISDSKLQSIKCGGQDIKVANVVVGHGNNLIGCNISKGSVGGDGNKCDGISRAVFITSSPLGAEEINSSGGGVNLLKLPEENGSGAFVLHLAHYSGACPKGLYLIHISCASKSDSPEADIKPFLDQILNTDHAPTILYSAYFTIDACPKCSSIASTNNIPANVYLCCGPSFELDYDQSVENAENLFKEIYPNDEFLPRAPDPEEIVMGDEDPTSVAEDVITLDSVKEQILELEAGLLNQEDCMEENSKNEEMAMEVGDE